MEERQRELDERQKVVEQKEKKMEKKKKELVYFENELSEREKLINERERIWEESRLGQQVRLGMRVPGRSRRFCYNGFIIGYQPQDERSPEAFWVVRHMDGDEGTLNADKLTKALKDYARWLARQKAPPEKEESDDEEDL